MNQNWRLSHLGMVVKNLDATIEQVNRAGLGKCGEVMPMEQDGVLVAKMCMATFGNAEIEFFQHISGDTMISQFLDSHGEGLHHLSFIVDDLDADLVRLTRSGVKLLWKMDVENGKFFKKGKIAFVETVEFAGTLLELEQIDEQ